MDNFINSQEVGFTFLPPQTIKEDRPLATNAALMDRSRVSFGVFQDTGFRDSQNLLFELANATTEAQIASVGFVVPRQASMVDLTTFATDLDTLAPGRVILGLVPGAWMEQIGLKSATPVQMGEAVNVIDYLLGKRTDGFNGKYYQIQPGFQLQFPTPDPRNITKLLGAYGEKMAEVGGKHFDQVKVGGCVDPAMVQIMRSRIKVGSDQVGRDANEIGIVLGATTVVGEKNEAMLAGKRRAVMYIDVIAKLNPNAMEQFGKEISLVQALYREGKVEEAVKALPDELANMFVIAGTPDDIIRHSLSIYSAGALRVEFGSPHGIGTGIEAELKGLDLMRSEVLPVLMQELGRNLT